MQRAAWTDERLDDMSVRMDSGFDRLDRDIRDLRNEMGGEFRAVRGEMRTEFATVRGEIGELRMLIWRLWGGILATLVAAILLRGI